MSENVCRASKVWKTLGNRLFPASIYARETKTPSKREAREGTGRVCKQSLSNLPFCADIQFSRNSIRASNDGIQTLENTGL